MVFGICNTHVDECRLHGCHGSQHITLRPVTSLFRSYCAPPRSLFLRLDGTILAQDKLYIHTVLYPHHDIAPI